MLQADWHRAGERFEQGLKDGASAARDAYAADETGRVVALPGYEWQGLHLVRVGSRNERIRNERLPLVVPTESKSSAALYVLIALIAPLAVGFLVWAALQ